MSETIKAVVIDEKLINMVTLQAETIHSLELEKKRLEDALNTSKRIIQGLRDAD